MKNYKENGKKVILVILLVTVVLLVLTSVNRILDNQMNMNEEVLSQSDSYQYHIAMIGNNPTDEFWISIFEGAKKAGVQQECYVENFGADLTGEYSVNELLEMAIAAKVDGIILQAEPGDSLKGLINTADKQKIPIMTILSDAPNSQRVSFVSCNNYALGEIYGNQILAAIEKQPTELTQKTQVTVLTNSSEEGSIPNLIISGIKGATAAVTDNINLSTVAINSSGKFESEETVRNLVLSEDYPDVIVCLSAIDTISAYQSVVDYKMVGKIEIIGYYSSDETLEGIQKGIIQATIAINAEEMGKVAIDGLHEYITQDYVSEYLPVTSELITSENVDEYFRGDGQESGL